MVYARVEDSRPSARLQDWHQRSGYAPPLMWQSLRLAQTANGADHLSALDANSSVALPWSAH